MSAMVAYLMSPARVEILPQVWLDARLALFFEASASLVVADLHLGYAAAHRASGNLLPMWGDNEVERRLVELLTDYSPKEMLWLGDSVHDLSGCEVAERFIQNCATPVVLLSGNHDRCWNLASPAPAKRGQFVFHHGDTPQPIEETDIEVIGHHHPAFSWRDGAGSKVKLPACIAGPKRLILPAFSPWAGGVPWNHSLQLEETLWAISPRRIFALTSSMMS